VKKVLNVGGGNKSIPLPQHYKDFEHVLLDIDPIGNPDIVCDARQLTSLASGQFDAVYCSHNLEHYYQHDVAKVLEGFLHVLKEGGVAQIRVPDIGAVMRACVEQNLDIEDTLYQSQAGPIRVLDVIYGYGAQIKQSGQDFYAHKTGFTQNSLFKALAHVGFNHFYKVSNQTQRYELDFLAFKQQPDPSLRQLLGLPLV